VTPILVPGDMRVGLMMGTRPFLNSEFAFFILYSPQNVRLSPSERPHKHWEFLGRSEESRGLNDEGFLRWESLAALGMTTLCPVIPKPGVRRPGPRRAPKGNAARGRRFEVRSTIQLSGRPGICRASARSAPRRPSHRFPSRSLLPTRSGTSPGHTSSSPGTRDSSSSRPH
jgi:hypothetical protein